MAAVRLRHPLHRPGPHLVRLHVGRHQLRALRIAASPTDGRALGDILDQARCLLIDFDGPRRRVKAKPLRGCFASLDSAPSDKGRQLQEDGVRTRADLTETGHLPHDRRPFAAVCLRPGRVRSLHAISAALI